MPVVCAWTDTDTERKDRQQHNTRNGTTRHDAPPIDYADATRRSNPASKPYSRNVSATRALSMGVLV